MAISCPGWRRVRVALEIHDNFTRICSVSDVRRLGAWCQWRTVLTFPTHAGSLPGRPTVAQFGCLPACSRMSRRNPRELCRPAGCPMTSGRARMNGAAGVSPTGVPSADGLCLPCHSPERISAANLASRLSVMRGGARRQRSRRISGTARSPACFSRLVAPHHQARLANGCRRAERPRSRCVGSNPGLPNRRPAQGRSSAGGPTEGVTQSRSRWLTRFSTPNFENQSARSRPSTARPASRPGPERYSSRKRRCEAPRDCECGSCRADS